MGTTKKLLVLCLVLIMGVVAVMPSTFSWYNHSGTHEGSKMTYRRNNLPVSSSVSFSSNTLTMSTKEYKMASDNEVYYDKKGNKEYQGTAISGTQTIGAGTSQYYGTTFTNTGSAPAYVNLYLNNFLNGNNFFIGTTNPSLTDKGISSTVHLANQNIIRVYFRFAEANNWSSAGRDNTFIFATTKGSSNKTKVNLSSSTENINAAPTSAKAYYYADLPANTTEFYFATKGGNNGVDDSGNTTMNWYRTKTFTDVQPEKGYYLTGYADDTYWYAECNSFTATGGLSIMKSFDKVYLNSGQKAYVNLVNGTNFTGASAKYCIGSTYSTEANALTNDYCSINRNTGLITATNTALPHNSTFEICTRITSSFGDTKDITTTVSNPQYVSAATVSMNIKIPGRTTEEDANGNQVTKDGTALVEWYIRNKDSVSCTFDNIYYTK